MKFTLLALAGAISSSNAAAGRQLRNVTPRKLDQNNNNQNQNQITSASSFYLERCVEVTTAINDDDGTIQALIKQGTALAEASYVTVFDSVYQNDAGRMLMPLGDYVSARVKAQTEKKKQFKESCQQMLEAGMCSGYGNQYANQDQAAEGEQEQQDANQDQAAEGDDAGRKLYGNYPNCGECDYYGYFAQEQDGQKQVDYDEAVEQFVEGIAECMETGYEDGNGVQYYIGFACGDYSDAAEYAVFLNEDCTVQTNTKNAANLLGNMGNDDGVSYKTLMSLTNEYLQEAFTTSMTCQSDRYDDPNEENNGNNNNQDQNQEEEVSEACREIAENALYVSYCYANQQEQNEAAQDEDQDWGNVDVQNADDQDEVCAVVNAKLQLGSEAEWTTFYDSNTQGTAYNRDKKGNLVGSSAAESSSSMHGGLIFLIVVAVIAVVAAPLAYINSKKNTTASETDYQGGTLS